MIEFLKQVGELFGNILGLAFEATLEKTEELANKYFTLIKRAAILWGVALFVSAGLYCLGYYTDKGLFFGLGTGLISVATLVWLVTLAPIWAGIQKLAEKSPIFAQIRNVIVTLTLGFSFLTVYIPLSHAWKNSSLFPVLLAMVAFLTLVAILTGKSLSPDVLVFRTKVLLFVVSSPILLNVILPEEVTASFQPRLKHVVKLAPKRILCFDADFFETASTTLQPKVWYFLNDKGEYECYDNPGSHPKTGDRLVSMDKATAKLVMQQEERKISEKAQQDRITKSVNQKESQPQDNQSEAARRLWAIPPSPIVPAEPVTLKAKTNVRVSTEISRVGDIIGAYLDGRATINAENNQSVVFEPGSYVAMKVKGLLSRENSSGPEIIFEPFRAVTPNHQRFNISSDLVVVKPSHEILKGAGETALGIGAGALLGQLFGGDRGAEKGALAGGAGGVAVAIATKGKHFELPAGSKITITGVTITDFR